MDGKYKAASSEMLQMYSIDGRLNGNFLLCAYILMKTKDQKSYREVLGKLKDKAIENNVTLGPKLVLVDFEKASTNVI